MCDTKSTTGILIGETPVSSAPPLILLQSEEDSVEQGSGGGKGSGEAEDGSGSISSDLPKCNEQTPVSQTNSVNSNSASKSTDQTTGLLNSTSAPKESAVSTENWGTSGAPAGGIPHDSWTIDLPEVGV
jgi:hypothetical protein